ncbi:hypothetical protein [Paraburkholderia caballeronis]|uniref:Uncharacterized protein n=1 Tax=Paraburkholderia caballeronis TaxID=416943 RepID=A0A1H7U642_9BURK|nr:hypothetical protein [Paraburkholderia caballeronis]PXW23372.1 hypothetical protein C7403_110110 [Paraburkholderia caballeronis]PXW98365.1 hypothetical protein C7407_110110 [Paraburkholderia caballeronis]RAJ95095.1 hypothetical protein C7409_110110 [Paraburkholderia caballeronis]SEC57429.1 hypothetical protein SAMN05445871_2450 [Paraburkholderia caballeronis]SEL92540.1 hypothetical protein SAMN05192542_1182 [Paraburkholderia caballeronis]
MSKFGEWKHDDLSHDLAAHLRGMTDRRVWVDMQLGPVGSTRPDVYTIPCSFTRFTPLAYECKVSRSDFLQDVTKGKYLDYLQFASGVIFAAPANILRKDDIPRGAGLMVRHADRWNVIKAPTLAKCPELPRQLWLKLLMDGERRDHEREAYMLNAGRRDLNEWAAAAKLREKFGDVVAAAVQDHLNRTTNRLSTLRAQYDAEIERMERRIRDVQARRDTELKSLDSIASQSIAKLAAVVGADANPENTYDMRERLNAMIALAQADTTVRELRSIVRSMAGAFRRFAELESAFDEHADEEVL